MTDAMMALISNIAYLDMPKELERKIGSKNGVTLGDLIEYHAKKDDDSKYTETFKALNANAGIKAMKIFGYTNQNGIGNTGMVAYCFETTGGEAVFSFRGTDALGNDLIKLGKQQDAAQLFVNSMIMRKKYDDVSSEFAGLYATGHSLGGNLAQYATIHTDIDNCAAFNTQGFTQGFIDRHKGMDEGKNINCYQSVGDSFWSADFVAGGFSGEGGVSKIRGNKNFGTQYELPSKNHAMANIIEYYSQNGYYNNVPAGGGFKSGVAAVVAGFSSRRIKADPTQLLELARKMSSYSAKLQELQTLLHSTTVRLDWQISSKQGIESRLSQAAKNMSKLYERADSLSKSIQTTCDGITAADNALAQQSKGVQYLMDSIRLRSELLPKNRPAPKIPIGLPGTSILGAAVASTDLTLLKYNINKK